MPASSPLPGPGFERIELGRRPVDVTPQAAMTPVFDMGMPAFQAVQRINTIYRAAGEARTTEAQIRATLHNLGPLPDGTLREVAERFGIRPAPRTRFELIRYFERMLIDRLREARRLVVPPRPPRAPAPLPPPAPPGVPIPLPAPMRRPPPMQQPPQAARSRVRDFFGWIGSGIRRLFGRRRPGVA
jgi:hypothetical protein